MEYQQYVKKATKNVKIVLIISLLILIITTIGVYIAGGMKKEERTDSLIKELIGATFENTDVITDDFMLTQKFSFNDKNSGKIRTEAIGDYNNVNTGTITSWWIDYDFFGREYVSFDISWEDGDTGTWDDLEIAKNNEGKIIGLGGERDGELAYEKTGASSTDSVLYTNSYLKDLLVAVVIIVCVVNFILISNIFIIKSTHKSEEKRKKEEIERKRIDERKQYLADMWNTQMQNIGFNKNDSIRVTLDNWFWATNENIYEAEDVSKFMHRYLDLEQEEYENKYETISVSDIQYFSKEGDIQYTTKVSGGGGGGSSLTGAIVGDLLAGEAGAIIGSRKQVQDIKSESVAHDSRQTLIRYYRGSQLLVISYDGFDVYNYLLKKIPEKDLLSIQLKLTVQSIENKIGEIDNVEEKLFKIKRLYENDLISKEEYENKKTEILSKI